MFANCGWFNLACVPSATHSTPLAKSGADYCTMYKNSTVVCGKAIFVKMGWAVASFCFVVST